MKSLFFYKYPIGRLGIGEENGAVSGVFFSGKRTFPGYDSAETPLIKKAAGQLEEYFAGKRREFDLPLVLHGTDFQVSVWKALQSIPPGQTRTYGDIAALVGKPKACRAVGMANNRNPVPIIVPCHRVIGRDGSLTGYGGGLPVKQYLLELEKTFYAEVSNFLTP
ncbi:MAG: methylated-DNA--[protein]-cysteine S-methyltransferase [Treponema sp.]|jgi:methylated-DNA-[protein]-cysteine S-methyltransferase|nr:methylated-DNA--[protein]-cysteine S-methyltransferase [Treponema sp.]